MHAAISLEDLVALVSQAYEEGYRGALDCKEGYALEAVEEFLKPRMQLLPPMVAVEPWRRYSVSELNERPVGTMLEHEELGRCWVENVAGEKCVRFESGDLYHLLTDGYPWSGRMRRLKLKGSL